MRIGAAAAALGVSVDTLRRWEREDRVEFERRGNQRYIRAEEVARLLVVVGHDRFLEADDVGPQRAEPVAQDGAAGLPVAVKAPEVLRGNAQRVSMHA